MQQVERTTEQLEEQKNEEIDILKSVREKNAQAIFDAFKPYGYTEENLNKLKNYIPPKNSN